MQIKTRLKVSGLIAVLALVYCDNNSIALTDDNSKDIDYSQVLYWLSLPAPVKPVDVFYLYPTSRRKTDDDTNICEIDNVSMLAGAKESFKRQATVFETTTADTAGIYMGLGPGIYHSYDYLFYYYNIRANAANRVSKFLGRQLHG